MQHLIQYQTSFDCMLICEKVSDVRNNKENDKAHKNSKSKADRELIFKILHSFTKVR